MLKGLFIGIDRYTPPARRLSCCVADATALGTLFEDSLGGDVTILSDDGATRQAIADHLAELKKAEPDDLVVVTFSGHGTEDHRLVPFDVDPDRVAESCLSLEDLAVALDEIPSNVLVILDCCFSGGFGGSRFFASSATRSAFEDRTAVQALANGSARVVITASGAGETAMETADYGHGLLTYHLLESLRGADDLGTAGRVSIHDVFQRTVQRVLDAAQQMREVQTPTSYGSLEGLPTLPVLTPGERYAAAFPDRVRHPATADWASLQPYGFDPQVIDSRASQMAGLNPLQLSAINDFGVLDGKSLLTVAPTGSGKTMIGELAAMRAVADGGRAVMLLPLRALVNDKFVDLTSTYAESARIVRATGEFSDQVGDILNGHFDLALLTYEKFANLTLGFPHVMRGIDVVVIDEVQMMADPGRGAALELLMTVIRSGHGRLRSPQIVALSAVIGDTQGLERWLGGSLLRTEHRPVPLEESVITTDGARWSRTSDSAEDRQAGFIVPEHYGGSESSKPYVIPLVRRLVADGKKVIVFRATKGECAGTARYLSGMLGLAPAADALRQLTISDPSVSSAGLRAALQHGVGFHNADLDGAERLVLENQFRDPDSGLRVLVATTTLAMGVNTPAEAVVIVGLQHPGGQPYTVAEYKNMAGRAGRPGHTDAGEGYLVATDGLTPDAAWYHYVLGSPEPIRSQFLTSDSQTLVLRCLAALGGSVAEGDLLELLDNSFAIWLRREAGLDGWDQSNLVQVIEHLAHAELVDREPSGNLTLTDLGRFAGESGIAVDSIVNVSSLLRYVSSPLTADDIILLAQVTSELDDVYVPRNKKSVKEKARWPQFLQWNGVSTSLLRGLHVGGGDTTDRAKRAAACLLFTSSASMEEIEHELMQHSPNKVVAGAVRSAASRTRDVLEVVIRVCEYRGHEVAEEVVDDLPLRLEIGLPTDSIGLASTVGAQLHRAQYLSLLREGVFSLEQCQKLGAERLTEIIGESSSAALLAMSQQPVPSTGGG